MDRDEDLNTTGWISSFDIAVDCDHSLDRCRYRPIRSTIDIRCGGDIVPNGSL